MKLGLLLLRLIVGVLFMGHGLQKLEGWFGGHGIEGTGQFFESLDLRPGKAHATAAGASEAVGGALIATGFLTPLGSTLLTGTMLTAIRKVHLDKGPWVSEGGYEYNLVLIAIVFALADVGPGPLSLDAALGHERSGLGWALAALAAGAAGSTAAIELGRRQGASAPAESTAPGAAPAPVPAASA